MTPAMRQHLQKALEHIRAAQELVETDAVLYAAFDELGHPIADMLEGGAE